MASRSAHISFISKRVRRSTSTSSRCQIQSGSPLSESANRLEMILPWGSLAGEQNSDVQEKFRLFKTSGFRCHADSERQISHSSKPSTYAVQGFIAAAHTLAPSWHQIACRTWRHGWRHAPTNIGSSQVVRRVTFPRSHRRGYVRDCSAMRMRTLLSGLRTPGRLFPLIIRIPRGGGDALWPEIATKS